MENIVKLVAEKTGISESQAKVAVDTVVSVLKDKLPAGIGSQVETYLQGGSASDSGLAGGITDAIGGMFK